MVDITDDGLPVSGEPRDESFLARAIERAKTTPRPREVAVPAPKDLGKVPATPKVVRVKVLAA